MAQQEPDAAGRGAGPDQGWAVPQTSYEADPIATNDSPSFPGPTAAQRLPIPARVPWRAIGVFLVIAVGLAWAIEAALAAAGGLQRPIAPLVLIAVMFTPMLGSLAACRIGGEPWGQRVGVRQGPPAVVLRFALFGFALVVLTVLLAWGVGTALGWMPFDASMPALREVQQQLPAANRPPLPTLFALTIVQAVVAPFTINGIAALGEESGWRGWLLPALWPLGRAKALLLTGAIWGLWHAPLIMMGYEYGDQADRPLGIAVFTGFCILVGTALGWLRMRSGSVLPAAVAHGTLNAWAGLPLLFTDPAHPGNLMLSTPGLAGLVAFAVPAAVLITRRWSPA